LNFKIKTPSWEFFYFHFSEWDFSGPPTVRDLRGRPEFPLYHTPAILSRVFAKIFFKNIFHKTIDFCVVVWYNRFTKRGKERKKAKRKKIKKNRKKRLTKCQKYGIIKTLQKRK